MSDAKSLLWRKPPVIWSFGIAVLSVAATLIISRLPSFHLQSAPVSLFLCAVMVSAWFDGTGMGLRIRRSIIESRGGRLWASDQVPHGASSYFTLPTVVEAHA